MYIQEMLPIFGNPNRVLFLSNKGKPYRQSNVGEIVIKTFQRTNRRMDINITDTRLWKFYTGHVFYRGADAQELVADHMAHMRTTARQKYQCVDCSFSNDAREHKKWPYYYRRRENNNADDKKGIELSGDSANCKVSSANCEGSAFIFSLFYKSFLAESECCMSFLVFCTGFSSDDICWESCMYPTWLAQFMGARVSLAKVNQY